MYHSKLIIMNKIYISSLKKILFTGFIAVMLISTSCTKLEEDLKSDLTAEQAEAYFTANTDVDALLQQAYREMLNLYPHYDQVFALQCVTTEECIIPTRPNGWDDDGKWRKLFTHTWDAEDVTVVSVFNWLNRAQFAAGNVLNFEPSVEIAAEARLFGLFTCIPFLICSANFLTGSPVQTSYLYQRYMKAQRLLIFVSAKLRP